MRKKKRIKGFFGEFFKRFFNFEHFSKPKTGRL
jgi:hypothetical protein